ncbi:MAG TPA: hypothetical protein VF157_11425 [Chloroflexota bacterium]
MSVSAFQPARWLRLSARRPAWRAFAPGALLGFGASAAVIGAGYCILAQHYARAGQLALASAVPLLDEPHLLGLAAAAAAPGLPACRAVGSALTAGQHMLVLAAVIAALGVIAAAGGLLLVRRAGAWAALHAGLLCCTATILVLVGVMTPLRHHAEQAQMIDLREAVDIGRSELVLADLSRIANDPAIQSLFARGSYVLPTIKNYERAQPHVAERLQQRLEEQLAQASGPCALRRAGQ